MNGSSRIVLQEGASKVLQLCERLSCADWSQNLLDDSDGLGCGAFPHCRDVSDFKGLQPRPRVPRPSGSV